jgi:hypothetical protein
LNADKTELLALKTGRSLTYEILYCGQNFEMKTEKELKICGLWYCNGIERENIIHITEKIVKLINNIRLWQSCNLMKKNC